MTVDVRWALLTATHSGLLHLLSPLEHERVASLSRPADRGRSMLAAALVRVVSAEYLDCAPEAVIVDYILSNNIDLLATGAYGHSRIRELIVGSLTTTLLRTSPVPVLIMR